jgi:putative mRNA 3-end processing factor
LGSAQVVLTYQGGKMIVSGDYKRSYDPTCVEFKPEACDVFVTEATFALPVFSHPPIADEIQKLLTSVSLFPERCHLVGVYALGKCQRLIRGLREAGYHDLLYLHGALIQLCRFYQSTGCELGDWTPVSEVKDKSTLKGKIVLAPPSALNDRWSRKLPDVLTVMASGWMQIRARSKQRKAELPLIISDHCDWHELLQTAQDVNAPEVWITHGREDALAWELNKLGFKARALSLLGYDADQEMDSDQEIDSDQETNTTSVDTPQQTTNKKTA